MEDKGGEEEEGGREEVEEEAGGEELAGKAAQRLRPSGLCQGPLKVPEAPYLQESRGQWTVKEESRTSLKLGGRTDRRRHRSYNRTAEPVKQTHVFSFPNLRLKKR